MCHLSHVIDLNNIHNLPLQRCYIKGIKNEEEGGDLSSKNALSLLHFLISYSLFEVSLHCGNGNFKVPWIFLQQLSGAT